MDAAIEPNANLDIINARLPGHTGLQIISIRQGMIREVTPCDRPSALAVLPGALDLAGDWVSLGGIDLQINGALGLAFPDLSLETATKLEAIAQFLWDQGVDGYLPTIVTTSIENIQRALATIAEFQFRNFQFRDRHNAVQNNAAQILGVHLEGPCLNPAKRGAHPAEYLRPLTVEQIKQVLGDYASVVKVVTLAPELDPTGETIAYLRSLGITVSLGHSQATAAQAQQAFAQGASMITHAFNAMPSLHHREPGLLGAAIANPAVYCGLIADGQHVAPLMIDLLLRASHYDRGIFLVSDALSPLGLPDGIYPWDTRQIEVKVGTARLPDGTLSGTVLPLLVGVENLIKWNLCDLGTAIALATTAPRQAIGLNHSYLGQPAHLIRWSQSTPTGDLKWLRL
jgi:N-acetylglucosamine-6-phosphate deacetylase